MTSKIPDRLRRIDIAEGVADVATLSALVLTYVLAAFTVELNPITSRLFAVLGYGGTAALAVVVAALAFELYRGLAEQSPRTAEIGAWSLGGGLFGGGGGPLIDDDAGSGAPIWATAVPALGLVAYAAHQRRSRGGSASSNSSGGRGPSRRRGGA